MKRIVESEYRCPLRYHHIDTTNDNFYETASSKASRPAEFRLLDRTLLIEEYTSAFPTIRSNTKYICHYLNILTDLGIGGSWMTVIVHEEQRYQLKLVRGSDSNVLIAWGPDKSMIPKCEHQSPYLYFSLEYFIIKPIDIIVNILLRIIGSCYSNIFSEKQRNCQRYVDHL